MESDDDDQLAGQENTVKLTKAFEEKFQKKECICCPIVRALAFQKSSEKNNIKNMDNLNNSNWKVTKEYLESFNKYGVNQNNWQEVSYKVTQALKEKDENDKDISKFTDIEAALLIDLAPEEVEEAFYLIPSLREKLKAEEMKEYLRKLKKEMKENY